MKVRLVKKKFTNDLGEKYYTYLVQVKYLFFWATDYSTDFENAANIWYDQLVRKYSSRLVDYEVIKED
jgi:hypothetical protein